MRGEELGGALWRSHQSICQLIHSSMSQKPLLYLVLTALHERASAYLLLCALEVHTSSLSINNTLTNAVGIDLPPSNSCPFHRPLCG